MNYVLQKLILISLLNNLLKVSMQTVCNFVMKLMKFKRLYIQMKCSIIFWIPLRRLGFSSPDLKLLNQNLFNSFIWYAFTALLAEL